MPKKTSRILIIGDLHEPFCLDGYLKFCKSRYKKWECNQVIFIGDVLDNHFLSYHETDPDGDGGSLELQKAIKRLSRWYKAFPVATVIIGNHDRMPRRKAHSSMVPSAWIRGYSEVLGVPQWNFVDRVVVDDVQYIHGEGGTARSRQTKDMMSTVQGHLHTQAYTDWKVGAQFRTFGMQVGCGIDNKAYAMSYAKNFPKPAIGCGIVIGGQLAINCMMPLDGKGS